MKILWSIMQTSASNFQYRSPLDLINSKFSIRLVHHQESFVFGQLSIQLSETEMYVTWFGEAFIKVFLYF